MIRCIYCLVDLPRDAFYKHSIRKKSDTGGCKLCMEAHRKKWYGENLELVREYTKRARAKDPERARQWDRNSYQNKLNKSEA